MSDRTANIEFLNNTYQQLLRRDPDKEGLNYWLKDLEEKGQTRDDVVANIKRSEEYKYLERQVSSD
tara:strand:+ start:2379 stop:2576 length:198 start_codon:yes stop_codon:yes gene_type:complete